jgi:hypothetical protein
MQTVTSILCFMILMYLCYLEKKQSLSISSRNLFYSHWYLKNLKYFCVLLCALVKIIVLFLQSLRTVWLHLKKTKRFEISMMRAFITGSFAEKSWPNTVSLLEKQKTWKYKCLRTGNSYQIQISILVICPLKLVLKASFNQKIKK